MHVPMPVHVPVLVHSPVLLHVTVLLYVPVLLYVTVLMCVPVLRRPEICSGGCGGTFKPQDGGGGGFRKWASKCKSQFCLFCPLLINEHNKKKFRRQVWAKSEPDLLNILDLLGGGGVSGSVPKRPPWEKITSKRGC